MKKKRCLSMLLVAALVITLFPASAMAAGVEQRLTLEGSINVVNPIYDIIVPTDLSFNVDSFGVFSQDSSSLISTGYAVVNRSPVAVQVDINASLDSASSTALVIKGSAADVTTNDTTNHDAELYFEIQPAKTAPIVTGGTFNYTAVTPGSVNITYAAMTFAVTPGSLNYASGQAIDTTTGHSVSFAIKRSPNAVPASTPGEITYNPGHTASDDAIAFKFAGKINPYAKWGTGNLAQFKVVAEFTFNALTVEGFNEVQARLNDDNGHGYLGAGTGAASSIPTYSKAAAADVTYTIPEATGSLTAVTFDGTDKTGAIAAGNISFANHVVSVKGATPFLTGATVGTHTMVFTIGGTQYTKEVRVTN